MVGSTLGSVVGSDGVAVGVTDGLGSTVEVGHAEGATLAGRWTVEGMTEGRTDGVITGSVGEGVGVVAAG